MAQSLTSGERAVVLGLIHRLGVLRTSRALGISRGAVGSIAAGRERREAKLGELRRLGPELAAEEQPRPPPQSPPAERRFGAARSWLGLSAASSEPNMKKTNHASSARKRAVHQRPAFAIAPTAVSQLTSFAVVGVDNRRFLALLRDHPEIPRRSHGKLRIVSADALARFFRCGQREGGRTDGRRGPRNGGLPPGRTP